MNSLIVNGIEFVVVNGNAFTCWSNAENREVRTYIPTFAIAKYPITNAEFLEFIRCRGGSRNSGNDMFMHDYYSTDSAGKRKLSNAAVYHIGWEDAAEFCNYLSDNEKRPHAYEGGRFVKNHGIRLPSDIEWTYAATEGDGAEYRITENIVCRENRIGINGKVCGNDLLYVNRMGIAGMFGNINEWTNSVSKQTVLKKFEKSGTHREVRRIIKGGSFASSRRLVTVHYGTDVSEDNLHYIGFRPMFLI